MTDTIKFFKDRSPETFESLSCLMTTISEFHGFFFDEKTAKIINKLVFEMQEKIADKKLEDCRIRLLKNVHYVADHSPSCKTLFNFKKYKIWEYAASLTFMSDRSTIYKDITQMLDNGDIKYKIEINIVERNGKRFKEPTIHIDEIV